MAEKKIPMRRCIGCMTSYPKNTLIRIAYDGQQLTVDTTGRARGRAWMAQGQSLLFLPHQSLQKLVVLH